MSALLAGYYHLSFYWVSRLVQKKLPSPSDGCKLTTPGGSGSADVEQGDFQPVSSGIRDLSSAVMPPGVMVVGVAVSPPVVDSPPRLSLHCPQQVRCAETEAGRGPASGQVTNCSRLGKALIDAYSYVAYGVLQPNRVPYLVPSPNPAWRFSTSGTPKGSGGIRTHNLLKLEVPIPMSYACPQILSLKIQLPASSPFSGVTQSPGSPARHWGPSLRRSGSPVSGFFDLS